MVPSHCGIPSNKKADSLAQNGFNLSQSSGGLSCRQSFSNIFRSVRKYIRQIQEDNASGKIWEALLHSLVPMHPPRQGFSAVFKTSTGHDFLHQHLHRIGVKTLQTSDIHSASRGPHVAQRPFLSYPVIAHCSKKFNY
ncbi:hypothetical protein TNCV_2203511 [Trichonephila clavipes]|nr:hypothetical protein TNCV_2203511 [Trichonephila clavipes]